MHEHLTVRVIRDFAEIENMRSTWESWQHHPSSDIDYYLSRFKLRPEFLRPHVIVVHRDGRPDALLVGRLDHLRLDLKLGYVHLLKPRVHVLNFVYSGLLGNQSPENCDIILGEILKSLRDRGADFAAFDNVRVPSPLYDLALSLPNFLMRDHFPEVNLHCRMTVPPSVEDIYRGLSAKARKNLKWQAKQLLKSEAFSAQIACFRGSEEVDRMIRDVEYVARKTYQRGLGVGFVDNPEMRERLALAARKGWLRTYVLYLRNQPSAFCVGTAYGGTYYTDFVGYDPQYAKYSPGTFLLMRMFEEFCSDGLQQVDFGYGVEGYKQRFGSCTWNEAKLRIYAPTARGLALKLLIGQMLLIDHLVRRILSGIKVLPRLKKFWRKQVRNSGPDPAPDGTASEA
ncbi:MAG: GNAT family N-acetyltransferase [Terriglobia bacterium]|jgi:hypothetical protein